MSDSKYNLVRALSWYTIGNVLIKSINFFTLKIFTSLISTNDFGVFGLFQSYLNIFEIIILLGTAHTIKMVKYDKAVDYDKYVSSIIYIPVIGTVLMLVVIQVCAIFTDDVANMSINLWRATFVTAGFLAVANIISSKLILEGKYKLYIVYSLIYTIVNISVSLILCYTVFAEYDTYWARIYGGIIASVVGCFFLVFFSKIGLPDYKYIKKGILLGLPLLVHAIATQILVQSDKIIISQIASYSAVGIYTVATNIVIIPNTLLSSIENSWSPWFFQQLSEKKYSEMVKKDSEIILGYALILCMFILAAPEVVKILAHRDYWDAIYVLIPLTIASFAELIYLMPLNLELYYKRNKSIWIYTVSIVVFNVIFDIIFIKMYGYLAGAYVTCVSRFGLFILHYFRAMKIDNNSILDIKRVLLCIVILFFCNVACILIKKQIVIRWCAIFAICIVSLLYLRRGKKLGGKTSE